MESLNFNNIEDYLKYIQNYKTWLGYQELSTIVNSYNIMFAIYSEATQYKNSKLYFIYKEQENSINSVILLNYNEGNLINQQKDISQHNSGYKIPQ